MWIARAAYATAVLSAAIGVACSNSHPAASTPDVSNPISTERAGTLSVAAFRFSAWHDEAYHYLPVLSVAAPATGRPVFVQRVDFTADDAGARRLLKGIRYEVPVRIEPGSTVELVSNAGAANPPEIASPLGLVTIAAVIFFADDEGRTGIVSAAAKVSDLPMARRRGSR